MGARLRQWASLAENEWRGLRGKLIKLSSECPRYTRTLAIQVAENPSHDLVC